MKNKIFKYFLIDFFIYLIIEIILLVFSKESIKSKIFGMVLLFAVNIIVAFVFILANYIWLKILKIEKFINLNYFFLFGIPISMALSILKLDELEYIIGFIPFSTIFLIAIYIKINILEKYE
jgi:hypothetical protein